MPYSTRETTPRVLNPSPRTDTNTQRRESPNLLARSGDRKLKHNYTQDPTVSRLFFVLPELARLVTLSYTWRRNNSPEYLPAYVAGPQPSIIKRCGPLGFIHPDNPHGNSWLNDLNFDLTKHMLRKRRKLETDLPYDPTSEALAHPEFPMSAAPPWPSSPKP